MSVDREPMVAATPIEILEPGAIVERSSEDARAARAKRRAERAEDARRWTAIEEAGGREPWIEAQLRAAGLFVDADPSSLSDSEKAAFKEKKRAEAIERRRLEKLAWSALRASHVVHVGASVFYSDTLDENTTDRDRRLARAKENGLDALETPAALAKALGLGVPELRWLAFHREVETRSHYHYWTIPKRDGTPRLITAPKPDLKRVQRWLLRNVFEKLPVHSAAHGFLRERSIATNAAAHAGAEVVLKVDLRDFFPTITLRRVKGLLRKAGLPEHVATLVALLSTEPPRSPVRFRDKTLFVATGPRSCPQGAPTSPAITNALCLRLDRRLAGLARKRGFVYTRYADDLVFSFRGSKAGSRTDAPIGAMLRSIGTILAAEGFRPNKKKTAVMRSGASQRVTGLVINAPNREGVPPARVPRDVVRRLKAAIHNREKGRPGRGETLAELKGLAAFVYMTDPERGRAFLDRLDALERG
jgi:RNA-directed DNA polymerase